MVGNQGVPRGGWSRTQGLRHSVDVLGPVMELTRNRHPVTMLAPFTPIYQPPQIALCRLGEQTVAMRELHWQATTGPTMGLKLYLHIARDIGGNDNITIEETPKSNFTAENNACCFRFDPLSP